MGWYGADTDQVQSVGRNIFDLEPDAASAVDGVLNSYSDAAGVAHHPLVQGALASYRETHQKAHLAFPEAVKGIGSNTAGAGATLADGNNEAASAQRTSLGDQQSLNESLRRPIQ